MNKHFRFVSLLVLVLSLAAGCGLIKKDDEEGGAGGGASSKALKSRWYVSNQAWSIDLTNVRTDDIAFAGKYIYADDSRCDCSFQFNGDNSGGAYKITGCSEFPGGGAGMSSGNCSILSTPGTSYGTYTNSAGTLCLARSGGLSCLDYF